MYVLSPRLWGVDWLKHVTLARNNVLAKPLYYFTEAQFLSVKSVLLGKGSNVNTKDPAEIRTG